MRIVDQFFDRQTVLRPHERAARRSLSRFGAFLRRRARSSLRRRKRVSAPGKPPSVHSRDAHATLKNILFGLESDQMTVLVGPVKTNQRGFLGGESLSGTVPQVMEFGGQAVLAEKRAGTRWVRVGRRSPHPGQPTRRRRASYKPRPFMGPALQKEIDAGTLPREYAANYG